MGNATQTCECYALRSILGYPLSQMADMQPAQRLCAAAQWASVDCAGIPEIYNQAWNIEKNLANVKIPVI
jgi:hypothetical protein